jgi:hypothetical protein
MVVCVCVCDHNSKSFHNGVPIWKEKIERDCEKVGLNRDWKVNFNREVQLSMYILWARKPVLKNRSMERWNGGILLLMVVIALVILLYKTHWSWIMERKGEDV